MTRRMTVHDAAEALGLTVDAIRKRVERGTIEHERDESRLWILVEEQQDSTRHRQDIDRTDLVEELRDRLRYLERQLDAEREARTEERRRHDTLLAQLMQRIPELEAPSSPDRGPDATVEADEAPADTRVPEGSAGPETASSRPWWRRWLGG